MSTFHHDDGDDHLTSAYFPETERIRTVITKRAKKQQAVPIEARQVQNSMCIAAQNTQGQRYCGLWDTTPSHAQSQWNKESIHGTYCTYIPKNPKTWTPRIYEGLRGALGMGLLSDFPILQESNGINTLHFSKSSLYRYIQYCSSKPMPPTWYAISTGIWYSRMMPQGVRYYMTPRRRRRVPTRAMNR